MSSPADGVSDPLCARGSVQRGDRSVRRSTPAPPPFMPAQQKRTDDVLFHSDAGRGRMERRLPSCCHSFHLSVSRSYLIRAQAAARTTKPCSMKVKQSLRRLGEETPCLFPSAFFIRRLNEGAPALKETLKSDCSFCGNHDFAGFVLHVFFDVSTPQLFAACFL